MTRQSEYQWERFGIRILGDRVGYRLWSDETHETFGGMTPNFVVIIEKSASGWTARLRDRRLELVGDSVEEETFRTLDAAKAAGEKWLGLAAQAEAEE